MSATPPLGESNYPRGYVNDYGSADKLQALGDGYYGLNRAFLVNFFLLIVVVASRVAQTPALTIGFALVMFLLALGLSFGPNKRIGIGMGWSSPVAGAILGSIFIALFCWLCFGALGYIVMQMIAANEMKKYGLKTGFGGIKKPVLAAAVADKRAAEAGRQAAGGAFEAAP